MESSEPIKKARTMKFAPRAPPRRVPKQEVKTEKVEDDDASEARDLLRRFNENEVKARHKVEKKVSSTQIAFGYGGESVSMKSYGLSRGGNNINGSSAFGGVREKEYKEPWDYNSNYPVTLPLRRPFLGNPELLDEEEFGGDVESRTYDEKSINPARDLGLLENNPEASLFIFKLPQTCPTTERSTTNAEGQGGNEKKAGQERPRKWNELPAGFMGKMVVHKSGAVKLKLGDTPFDVSTGMNCTFAQEAFVMNPDLKQWCSMGEIIKHATITPDIDSILGSVMDNLHLYEADGNN